MASLNLLFVHEVNYQSKVIFEMHEFPELLAARGNQITFLDFPEGDKFWNGSRPKTQQKIAGRTQPQISLQLERPFTFGVPGLDRLVATLSVIPKLISLLRSNRFDAIVLYAVPTYGAQVVWLAKRFGVPVIFRALDVSHKIRRNIFAPAIKLVEKYVYKNVDLLSANNPAMADYCVEMGNRNKKVAVNLPPLDLSHFSDGESVGSIRDLLSLKPNDQVAIYMGTFFYFSGLEEVIKSFSKVSNNYPNLKLLLVGGGEQDSALRSLVADLGLRSRVIFTGFVPYDQLPSYIKVANIAMNTLVPSDVSHLALPHKVFQYMASGVPVVSTKLNGLMKTLGENSGVTWANSPNEVIAEVLGLISNPFLLNSIRGDEIQKLSQMFSGQASVESFLSSIESAMSRQGRDHGTIS